MKKHLILLSMASLMLLSSCATKQSALNSLRGLQQEIEVNGAMYSINDWKNAAEQYAKINKKIYKHYSDYTAAELEEIGRINGECAASFAKGTAQSLSDKAQSAIGLIKGLVNGVKESFNLQK